MPGGYNTLVLLREQKDNGSLSNNKNIPEVDKYLTRRCEVKAKDFYPKI